MHYLRPRRLLRAKLNEYLVQRLPREQIHASPGLRPCFPFTKETQFNFKRRPNTRARINGIQFACRPTSLLLVRARRTTTNHRDSMERAGKRFETKGIAVHCAVHCIVKFEKGGIWETRASSRAVLLTICR